MKNTTKLFFIAALFVSLSAGVNAQNILSANFETCGDAYDNIWVNNHKNGTGTEIGEFATDPADANNMCLKADNGTGGGQARIESMASGGLMDLTGGVTYVYKVDRYVTASTVATGEKMFIYEGSAKKFAILPNKLFGTKDQWESLEYTFTPSADMSGVHLRIQINPGAATVYYDNFSIAPQADMNDITFNIVRPDSLASTVWITMNGESKRLKIGTPDSTSTTFSIEETGSYSYAITGIGFKPVFSSIDVSADANLEVALEADDENVNGLSLYGAVNDSVALDSAQDRVVTKTSIYKGELEVFTNTANGFWPGNLNMGGAGKAGAYYTYEMAYNGQLKSGWINPSINASANGTKYEYLGWFKAGFIITNENNEGVEAMVTIKESGAVADSLAMGVYGVDVKNDGTLYHYAVVAEGYEEVDGTFTQMGVDVEKDTIINVTLEMAATNLSSLKTTPLSVYPNPATNLLRLSENVEMAQVYNISGRLVNTAYNTNTIDLSAMKAGIYMLKVNDIVLKFVKQY